MFFVGNGRIQAAFLALAGLSAAGEALAQTRLPPIVVTPSPIVRRAPAVVTAPTPSDIANLPAPDRDLRGVLPVVTDQFATVTVVTAEELQGLPGATLGDVLVSKPGITGSSFAPGAASRPIIRGLDNYRVRIQENGLATNDVSDLSEDHGVPIDPLAAQRIEVVRGPATLRWGSQAIGGVVNVENNRIPDAIPPRGFGLETRGAIVTGQKGREGGVLLDAGAGNFALHADAFGRNASDYRIPNYPYLMPEEPGPFNGLQPNTGNRASGQSVGGSYVYENGFVGVAFSNFDSLYRIPGEEATATNTRIDLKQTKVTGKGEFRPQSSAIEAIRFWAGTTDYKHSELANENGFDGVQQRFTNKAQEGRIEIQLTPFDLRFAMLTTAFGVQAGRQELTAPGTVGPGLFDPNDMTSVAGFLFNELRFNDAQRLQVAGRIETVKLDGVSPDFPADFLPVGPDPLGIQRNRDYTPKSAAIGFLQDLPWGMVASVTGQYVERAPRAPELFSRGVHEATGTFEIGDPALGIEAARTVEIGLRRAQGPLRFEATAYYTEFKGFIFKRLTGNTCDDDFASCVAGPGGELNQIVYSQRDATFQGGEVAAQLDLLPVGNGMFGIDGQYDTVRAQFNDGSNVPRIPPRRFGGGAYWRSENWFARVGILRADAQTRVAMGETETGGYDIVKAELSYTQKLKDTAFGAREFTFGVAGNNLLDDDVRNSVSFKKDEVLLPGRSVRFFANLKF